MVAEMNLMASTNYCDECGASNPSQAMYCFACNNTLQTPLHVQAASINNATDLKGKPIDPLIPSYLLHSRYTIVSQVGSGGFGAVYKAKDTLFSHRLVAIMVSQWQVHCQRRHGRNRTGVEREIVNGAMIKTQDQAIPAQHPMYHILRHSYYNDL
jgi:hypothetical protein